jgi:hypothetical protein
MGWRDLDPSDELDDREYPEGDDADDSSESETETLPCPHCLRSVYEDAERCPSCGAYLSREDAPARRPWWMVLGVLICLAVVLGWVVR